jgi:hypothetical protein
LRNHASCLRIDSLMPSTSGAALRARAHDHLGTTKNTRICARLVICSRTRESRLLPGEMRLRQLVAREESEPSRLAPQRAGCLPGTPLLNSVTIALSSVPRYQLRWKNAENCVLCRSIALPWRRAARGSKSQPRYVCRPRHIYTYNSDTLIPDPLPKSA